MKTQQSSASISWVILSKTEGSGVAFFFYKCIYVDVTYGTQQDIPETSCNKV